MEKSAKMDPSDDDSTLLLNLKGHKKPVTAVTFRPDGQQIASSSEDKSIMLWNMSENVRSYNLIAHNDFVSCVEYAPHGKLLASCSYDHTVRLWIPTTCKGTSTEFKAHASPIRTCSFSPDSEKLITGANDKSIKIWSVQKKQFFTSLVGHNNWIRSIKYSADGKLIVSCSDDKTVKIWDATSSTCIHTFTFSKGHGSPTSLSLHKNNKILAVALDSGSVRIYDMSNNILQQHYVLHDNTTSVCWHPNKNYLLTSGKDGKVVIVDVMEGRPLYTIGGHEKSVSSVTFNSDGSRFASAGEDKHIMIWKANLV